MYNEKIEPLLHHQLSATGGICWVLAMPKSSIESMPDWLSLIEQIDEQADPISIHQILLYPPYNWLDLSSDFKFTTKLIEAQKDSLHGSVFNYVLSLSIPSDDFEKRGELIRKYTRHEWVLLVKEKNAAIRVLGNKNKGCTFVSELNTGKTFELNKNEISFQWTHSERALYMRDLFTEVKLHLFDISYDSFNGEININVETLNLPANTDFNIMGWDSFTSSWILLQTVIILNGLNYHTAPISAGLPANVYYIKLMSTDNKYQSDIGQFTVL